jgi:outer membrane protein insertion porin family
LTASQINVKNKDMSQSVCKAQDVLYKDTFTYSAGDVVGGNYAGVFNTELLFPVAEQYGLRGLAFFDVGNAWNGSFNLSDFRRSVGVGAHWMSPFGPLRVELGFPISKQPHDQTSLLGFSMGGQ